ncbi:MAG TPA: hypothetical protein DD713_03315 [Nitrospiraceae bacterium]|nr:hypothetical protein [Nitrospiraceae bacterium]
MFHRFMYELCIGPIPEGMLVCHTCDIERCGNPEHLFLGTHKDNTQDAINKGRFDPRRLGNLQIYKAMLKVH